MPVRRRPTLAAVALLAVLPGLSCLTAPRTAQELPDPPPTATPPATLASFVGTWCLPCHAGPDPEGGERLEPLAGDAPPAALVQKARRVVASGEMPPAHAPQPAASQRDAALLAFAAAAEASVATAPPDPGRPVLRRLTRAEYVNAVRDLLGVEVAAGLAFPADDLGHGFDGIGAVLSVSPLLLEKYANAAERIAAEAIVADPSPRAPRRFEAESLPFTEGAAARPPWLEMFGPATATARVTLPADGEYVLRARGFAQQAGPEIARLAFGVDGRRAGEAAVRATRAAPGEVEVRVRLLRGAHDVSATFVNDYYQPRAKDPKDRDRNLILDWIEVEGPVGGPEFPPSHLRVFAADPREGGTASRARAVLAPLVRRAWRRPGSEDDLARLAALVEDDVARGGTFERGVALALEAVLVSPRFVFRLEPGEDARPLDGYEVAARLALFLWSSLPDDALLDAAAAGRLATADGAEAEARRMLRDPRASALATNFAAQWLELRNLAVAAPDPVRFPSFDEDLRASMRAETEAFFEAVLREERDLRELLTADWTFLDERLARHYGVPGVRGPALRRVRLDGARPGGLLGHASVLTVTSNPTRTSPVKRGRWILEHLLDAPPPPPPPGNDSFRGGEAALAAEGIRAQMERHRADPACAVCHQRMDALGLALEHFDAVGAWRAADGGRPVDAAATLPDGTAVAGAADLARILAEGGEFPRAVARKLFVYAVGRGADAADEPAFDALLASLPRGRATLGDLICGVVRMEAFRARGASSGGGG